MGGPDHDYDGDNAEWKVVVAGGDVVAKRRPDDDVTKKLVSSGSLAAPPNVDSIVLTSGTGLSHVKEQLQPFYRHGLFCDAEIFCRDGTIIPCHRLVLAAISSTLAQCLLSAGDQDTPIRVHLPDHDTDIIRSFLDGIYGCLGAVQNCTMTELIKLDSVVCALRTSYTPWPTLSPKVVLPVRDYLSNTTDPVLKEEEHGGGCFGLESEQQEFFADDYDDHFEDNGYDDMNEGRLVESQDQESRPEVKEQEREAEEEEVDGLAKSTKAKSTKIKGKKVRIATKKLKLSVDHRERNERRATKLEWQMHSCEGCLRVKMSTVPEMPTSGKPNSFFRAILGIKSGDDGKCLAVPLNWSPMTKTGEGIDYLAQYTGSLEAARAVFGLSEVEAYYHSNMKYGLFGKESASMKTDRPLLIKEMSKWNNVSLRTTMECEEVSWPHKRTLGKEQIQVDDGQMLELTLVKDIPNNELDGIMQMNLDRQLEGYFYCVGTETRIKDAWAINGNLIRNWTLHTSKQFIPPTKGIAERFMSLQKAAQTMEVAQELLGMKPRRTRRVSKRTTSTFEEKDEQCPLCGRVFHLKNGNDLTNFRRHKKECEMINQECGCSVTFESDRAKIRHFKLVHTDDYEACRYPNCSFIFLKEGRKHSRGAEQREGHEDEYHLKKTCEICGMVLTGRYQLAVHTARRHPEQAEVDKEVAKELIRVKAEGGTCDLCGAKTKNLYQHRRARHAEKKHICSQCGESFFSKHLVDVHFLVNHTPQDQLPFPCQQCHRRYPTNGRLSAHIRMIHTTKEEKKFPCPHCNHRFGTNSMKKNHIVMQHIKVPHCIQCRYPNCDRRFNDYRCRKKHEIQVHTYTYTQAAELGLVPKKKEKMSYTEEFRAAYKLLE